MAIKVSAAPQSWNNFMFAAYISKLHLLLLVSLALLIDKVVPQVVVPSKQHAGAHYEEHDGKPFFPKLVNFLSSSAVVAMVGRPA